MRAKMKALVLIIFITLSAPLLEAQPHLFPLFNVTPGKTTVQELAAMGKRATAINRDTGQPYHYFAVKGVEFWYHNGVATYVSFDREKDPVPEPWTEFGFDWELSYNGWIDLLRSLDFPFRIKVFPQYETRKFDSTLNERHYVRFKASIEAFIPGDLPLIANIKFYGKDSAIEHTPGTLYRFTLNYKPELQRFDTPLLRPNPEKSRTLTEEHRRALGLSGILAEINHSYHEKLNLASMGETSKKNYLELIKRDWGIETRQEFLEMIESLRKDVSSVAYDDLVQILDSVPEDKTIYETIDQRNLRGNQVPRLFYVESMRSIIDSRSLRAWSYGRVVSLARWGYQVGFLSEQEAWEIILPTAEEAYTHYSSWEEYGTAFTLGRLFWASGHGESLERGNQAIEVCTTLLNTEGNVWRGAWGGVDDPKSSVDVSAPAIRAGKTLSLRQAIYLPSKRARAWGYYQDGIAEYKGNVMKRALEFFEKAYKLDPDLHWALWYHGLTLLKQGEYRRAAAKLDEYVKKWPHHYRGHTVLGEALDYSGSHEQAVESLRKAILIDPFLPHAFIARARAYINLSDYSKAITDSKTALNIYSKRKDADTSYAHYLLGLAHYSKEEYDSALPSLLSAYDRYRQNAQINYLLGVCFLKKGDPNDSMAAHYLRIAKDLGYELSSDIEEFLQGYREPGTSLGISNLG